MENENKPKPIKLIHNRLPTFSCLHSDGVWATVNGEGFIQLNFFNEQPTLQPSCIMPVDESGNAKAGALEFPEIDPDYFLVNRDIQVGIVVSVKAAKRIRDVMDGFINLAEKQESK